MPPSDFAKADLDAIVEGLTTEEAISLVAGVGFWHTAAVPRLGVPAIKMSDGPNGIRGNHFFMGTPAKCLPSATALGATFDPELIRSAGLHLLAEEAKLRGASIALAPTCNIQRNPLGGRSFESFSEDPHLSGMIAAAYVAGMQDGGIGATIKHFVANDKENDRFAYDSVVPERALREIYLMPFMIAQRDAKPWGYMTAYNRVNGLHASENPHVIQDVLRKEWGFEGLVMSDWFGTYSVDPSINAGLDLEMPGTNKWRTLYQVKWAITSRKTTVRTVKERARAVLEWVRRCAREAPEVLDGDGVEQTHDPPASRALMRSLAASSIVLLKNTKSLLPLNPASLKGKKVAIVGGNAKAVVLSGGGSAALKPSYFVSPYEGIEGVLREVGVEVGYGEGARAYKTLPTLERDLFTSTGERGWTGTFYAHESDDSMVPLKEPYCSQLVDETSIFVSTRYPEGITERWTLVLEGVMRREEGCVFEFGMCSSGRAKLFVDGTLVIDNWTRQVRGGSTFFGSASVEVYGTYPLKANTDHVVRVEFCNVRARADGDEDEIVMDPNSGVRLGGAEKVDPDALMERAVEAARGADVVIAVVGLNADWESEGHDRINLDLPGRTDELVGRVAEANQNTVVVTQSGSSIVLPWADKVSAIVHSWYLGNATGDAIADVLFGKVNPSGKLSLTFPKRLEDVPSHGHFHSEHGKVWYGENLYVGYKHYVHRGIEPAFAFGHGLSYTTFSYDKLTLSEPVVADGNVKLTASVQITNTGTTVGSEVVQLYVTLPTTSELTHPPLQLKGFGKVKDLEPGKSAKVELGLDKYAASYWEERISRWVVERGEYAVKVGPSSAVLPLSGSFKIVKGFEWNGL